MLPPQPQSAVLLLCHTRLPGCDAPSTIRSVPCSPCHVVSIRPLGFSSRTFASAPLLFLPPDPNRAPPSDSHYDPENSPDGFCPFLALAIPTPHEHHESRMTVIHHPCMISRHFGNIVVSLACQLSETDLIMISSSPCTVPPSSIIAAWKRIG